MYKSEDKELVEATARLSYTQYEKYLSLVNGQVSGEIFPFKETNTVEKEYFKFMSAYYFSEDDCAPVKAHNKWVELMQSEGWIFDYCFSIEHKRHPWITIYSNLKSPKDKHRALFIFSLIYAHVELGEVL